MKLIFEDMEDTFEEQGTKVEDDRFHSILFHDS